MSLLYSKVIGVIMGRINTSKSIYEKNYGTNVHEERPQLRSLYRGPSDIKHSDKKVQMRMCVLRPTPIRSN